MTGEAIQPGLRHEIEQRRRRDEVARLFENSFQIAVEIELNGIPANLAGEILGAGCVQQTEVVIHEIPMLPCRQLGLSDRSVEPVPQPRSTRRTAAFDFN